jgi:glycosyltransferase involved in cell wall biosynthesis
MKLLVLTYQNMNVYGINKVLKDLIPFINKKLKVSTNINFFKFLFSNIDIVHIHGLWHPRFFIFFLIAKLKKNKIIISPHGMLDPESLAINFWKKKIALTTYQGIILRGANLMIVNSSKEKKNLQNTIKCQKVAIIIHGIILKTIKRTKNKDLIHSLYFSKIHPIKNLLKLVQIWSFSKKLKNFKLSILGEIDDVNYFNKVNKIIKNSKNIFFLGKIKKNKIINLSLYDVFILPSKSENFGLVVLEALNAGLYLILNKALPWKKLVNNKFASLINFNSHNLENEILHIEKNKKFLLSKSLYKKKILYLKSNYDWKNISQKYILEYRKLIF